MTNTQRARNAALWSSVCALIALGGCRAYECRLPDLSGGPAAKPAPSAAPADARQVFVDVRLVRVPAAEAARAATSALPAAGQSRVLSAAEATEFERRVLAIPGAETVVSPKLLALAGQRASVGSGEVLANDPATGNPDAWIGFHVDILPHPSSDGASVALDLVCRHRAAFGESERRSAGKGVRLRTSEAWFAQAPRADGQDALVWIVSAKQFVP